MPGPTSCLGGTKQFYTLVVLGGGDLFSDRSAA